MPSISPIQNNPVHPPSHAPRGQEGGGGGDEPGAPGQPGPQGPGGGGGQQPGDD